ncbi:hypothetical protein HMPREF9711_00546 [Myroides odoratimimus CCUG 3837]|nr:hypothetical protein HMPREF9711_00546 [Myroides odoratimimus CCUG 3837]
MLVTKSDRTTSYKTYLCQEVNIQKKANTSKKHTYCRLITQLFPLTKK